MGPGVPRLEAGVAAQGFDGPTDRTEEVERQRDGRRGEERSTSWLSGETGTGRWGQHVGGVQGLWAEMPWSVNSITLLADNAGQGLICQLRLVPMSVYLHV